MRIFMATTVSGMARSEETAPGVWLVERLLTGTTLNCLAWGAHRDSAVYAGVQGAGVLKSLDAGKTWQRAGLDGRIVKSLAVSVHDLNTVYAGCKPVSLFVTHDGGASWRELDALRKARRWWWFSPADPPGWLPYVQAIALSPGDPHILLAGIELGAVLRSEDGGRTWSHHCKGALRDCHSMIFHATDPNWVYEGGGTGVGAAYSRDGGKSWQQPAAGLGKRYGWMVAADPDRPEVWYLSASAQPSLLRGEFVPPAHNDGRANAHLYRTMHGEPWQRLGGGLPQPLDYMAYGLATDPAASGHLYAGLSNGDVWHTADYGESWGQLPFNLGAIHRSLILLA